MKLATFRYQSKTCFGFVERGAVRQVCDIAAGAEIDFGALLTRTNVIVSRDTNTFVDSPAVPLSDVELMAPVPRPGLILGVGLNYANHARQMGRDIPDFPATFVKSPSSITGPYGHITHSGLSDTLDYEGELGIVIGKVCSCASQDDAADNIAGFLIVNDLSLREYVVPDRLTLAKSGDGFAPMGPWLTTRDEIADPSKLRIQTWVNGELRQDSNTSEMIFDWKTLVEIISRFVTLQPGDIITTGSPPGSGVSFNPKIFLQPDDVVRVEIEGLGAIENKVVSTKA